MVVLPSISSFSFSPDEKDTSPESIWASVVCPFFFFFSLSCSHSPLFPFPLSWPVVSTPREEPERRYVERAPVPAQNWVGLPWVFVLPLFFITYVSFLFFSSLLCNILRNPPYREKCNSCCDVPSHISLSPSLFHLIHFPPFFFPPFLPPLENTAKHAVILTHRHRAEKYFRAPPSLPLFFSPNKGSLLLPSLSPSLLCLSSNILHARGQQARRN